MDEDQEYNNEEINELVEDFKEKVDAGELGFYDSDDLELIADELIARFEFAYATEAVEHGIALYPNAFSFRILKVKKLIMELEIESAGRELDAIEEEFPPQAEFYLEKAFYYKMSGQDNDALPLLQKAYELDSESPEINFMLGGEYAKNGLYKRAYDYVAYALGEDESLEDQLFTLSYVFEDNKCFSEAVKFFKRLAEEFPLSKGCWFALGLAYSWVKDAPNALDAYQNAISLDEGTSTAYFNIGNVYFESKDFENAIQYYEQAYKLDDQDFHAVSGIGDCYCELHQYDKALEKYHEALQIEPNTMDAIMGIITILKATGRNDEAEEFIKKSFSLNPQSFELLFSVLPLYDESDQIGKLKELFQITISQVHNREDFLKFFTIYCSGTEELREMGISLLEEYLDDPELTMTLPYLLAALHYLCGHIGEANNYLRNALLINYDDHEMFLALHPTLESYPVIRNMIELYRPNS